MPGPTSYAKYAEFSSQRPFCHCCRVRSLELVSTDSFCSECTLLSEKQDEEVPRTDGIAESYEKCSNHYYLCSVEEDLVKECNVIIEHKNRPVEFLVASYIPPVMVDAPPDR
jgi:hypothetical protein